MTGPERIAATRSEGLADREPPAAPALAGLPQVDRLLRSDFGRDLIAEFGRAAAADAIRGVIKSTRECLRSGAALPDPEEILIRTHAYLRDRRRPTLRRAINATGVLLNTNLGRAPLAQEALDAVVDASARYSTLEIDLDTGRRGSRQVHARSRLARLTGAEAALVVNNNAAGVLLAVAAIGSGREVIVSRGELVEIGGSFRIPEIIELSGCRLVEVGTTNRTRVEDYRRAITTATGLLLRVHPSNYRIQGFTESPLREELVALGREHGIPVIEDLGSGSLVDLSGCDLEHEPTVSDSLNSGVNLVTFSGDKLLGGPQAGVLAGGAAWVESAARHPLARAVRCDKMTLAALDATLAIYEAGREWERIPLLNAIRRPVDSLRELAQEVRLSVLSPLRAESIDTTSTLGGGAMPGSSLPSAGLALSAPSTSDAALAALLRSADPPVIGRIQDGRVLLDLRTVGPDEVVGLIGVLAQVSRELAKAQSESG